MSNSTCAICGKAHPTSECVNVTVQYDCRCEHQEATVKDGKCVCPVCDRLLACKEEEFKQKCKCLADEKFQAQMKCLEEQRCKYEEKCLVDTKKEFRDQCVKEQKALQEKRRQELEKCRQLECNPLEECDCDVCDDPNPKLENCSNDLTDCMDNLKLQCSKVMRSSTDSCDNDGGVSVENIDCPPGAEKFAKCVAKCAKDGLSKKDCSEIESKKKDKC